MDRDRDTDIFVEQETVRLAKVWNTRTPGHLEWQKAYNTKRRGGVLTERQELVLKDSIETAMDAREQAFKEELKAAYKAVENKGPDDPFDCDFTACEFHQHQAIRDTAKALKQYNAKYKRGGGNKRVGALTNQSPSKATEEGPAMRQAKKAKAKQGNRTADEARG
jgi:hypothetical protein